MEFVQGLPKGVYVGQTRIEHAQAIATSNQNLTGFNLALHVNDDPQRVQQHRMILLNELSAYGVDKITWMTQTHSTICHTVNEQISFVALEGDGLVTQSGEHRLGECIALCGVVCPAFRTGIIEPVQYRIFQRTGFFADHVKVQAAAGGNGEKHGFFRCCKYQEQF